MAWQGRELADKLGEVSGFNYNWAKQLEHGGRLAKIVRPDETIVDAAWSNIEAGKKRANGLVLTNQRLILLPLGRAGGAASTLIRAVAGAGETVPIEFADIAKIDFRGTGRETGIWECLRTSYTADASLLITLGSGHELRLDSIMSPEHARAMANYIGRATIGA